ncbi:type I restriction endonuclease subunit R [Trueperella pyogenes]|uniref:type I restriction endonuclease subunit R n=1 Tax=Trueperella pyogenes TaxID=1661 RepID=UPI0024BF63CE|nr:type I restriction endonuclease subunit R [Trueperella pyogenes]WHU60564.1 type I restriction endonuclease subunit R [Trueperella pyogenes]
MTEASSTYRYAPVAASKESTVVARYEPEERTETSYQTEAQLEAALVAQLQRQAYERVTIGSEAELEANVRTQLEIVNDYLFTDSEWERFYRQVIANAAEGIVEKTEKLQGGGHIQALLRDDGTTKNITLLDRKNIQVNRLQVMNQYVATSGTHENRYDVTILVNGLPMVHVELKRRGVPLEQAFNQIERYQRESFWSGTGLFEYVQIFIISNGTFTRYYANTTREGVISENRGKEVARKTSNSYKFTIQWADATNAPIVDLVDFTKTFLAKHSLLAVLTRYCVFNASKQLMVMRPYQIVAAERILQKIDASSTVKQWGKITGGGYIWHTTGSGKTLTSFKTAQLATERGDIAKVLFVVDRKDLDYQTMKEYDRFQKGAANGNTSTDQLKKQLENPSAKIIVTTIQKLANFVKSYPGHPVFAEHVVIIFDECHRSQFGDMHAAIRKSFKKYHLFGFTGTPIFAENAGATGRPDMRTTPQLFGERLHTYTIVDAITDGNVLPFMIDSVDTMFVKSDGTDDAIADYNETFGTTFSTDGQGFENYYKDVSQKMKERKLDLLIVVNMFLTGFDATTLNTLWVDKNLKSHGLIQAFSRTNRILNSVKTYGNIICFRDLRKETNEALRLFGNKDAESIVVLKPYKEYLEAYLSKVEELNKKYPVGVPFEDEDAQRDFISIFGAIKRLINILDSFTEFGLEEAALSERDFQDYQGTYAELYREFREKAQGEKESIADDLVFEMELVRRDEVNVAYILQLIRDWLDEHPTANDAEIRADVSRAIGSSPSLHKKRELIESFLSKVNAGSDVDSAWATYVAREREKELADVIATESLDDTGTRRLVDGAFRDGTDIPTEGTRIASILPPVSRFGAGSNRGAIRARVIARLQDFVDRFRGLGE